MQVLLCLSLVLNVYYVRSIITIILSLSPVNQQWPPLIFNKKKLHYSRVVKRCTRFWTQVRILILHLSFMHRIFTLYFNQLQYLHFVCHQIMLWMIFSRFLHATFLTSICEISHVPRWSRTDDSWIIYCLLTTTLYHCATEDYGHVLLFVYLYLNLPWIY